MSTQYERRGGHDSYTFKADKNVRNCVIMVIFINNFHRRCHDLCEGRVQVFTCLRIYFPCRLEPI